MNKTNLKSYAPQARLDFIAAVTARANLLGITSKGASPVDVRGDVAIIDGREWPAKIAGQREKLIARITRLGFEQSMEEIAYTWFNRFAALRYMELHDYLDHGWRVLSSREGGLPEILGHASEVSLSGLSRERARELHMAGNQDNELYKLLLVAQCNELSRSMPFMFERIDDDTELLLPENLLRTDSVLAKMISSVPEQDWSEIEVIGWLYQFYITAKKSSVMGAVVKSEDIPAATQLFTPNWIVKFLVQNSVGQLWSIANPESTLSEQWDYFVKPAGQSKEASSQLDALMRARLDGDGGMLNPETITVLDPACGSGHILLEAYNLLRSIYLERGYQARAIPRLILERNLFGIDIDDRAAQLAGFALLMRARADDRRLLDDPPRLNILSLQESKGIHFEQTVEHLGGGIATHAALGALLNEFLHAKTFGSLIKVSPELEAALPSLERQINIAMESGDLYSQAAAQDLRPLLAQACVLGKHFDAIIANPPYMGGKGMNSVLKDFARAKYPDSKSDLFAMFIERGFSWCKPSGINSMVTMHSWMFLAAYETMRSKLLKERSIVAMAHLGARAFTEISGEIVQTTAFAMRRQHVDGYRPSFFRLTEGLEEDKAAALRAKRNLFDASSQEEFAKIPGSPIAYWVGQGLLAKFTELPALETVCPPKKGLVTSDNGRFLRQWQEVSFDKVGLRVESRQGAKASGMKWFPINCGGSLRRWFGNADMLINWESDGEEIISYAADLYGSASRQIQNTSYYFRESLTWSNIASGDFGARYSDSGFVFGAAGTAAFAARSEQLFSTVAFLNSKVATYILKVFNPTLNFVVNDIAALPFDEARLSSDESVSAARECVRLAREDWNSFETSWDFERLGFCQKGSSLSRSWTAWAGQVEARISRVRALEEANNRMLIDAYGLQDELTPEVPDDQITMTPADRESDCRRLLSYAMGCMMGRFSLDEPGLVYAKSGNAGFDPSRYVSFTAGDAGIVPITEDSWFQDEAASRTKEFLAAIWGHENLSENMAWLAGGLPSKAGDSAEDTIRRFYSDRFFKDHLQIYRRRPIYWMFSSGKQGAFQALVYAHRYNDGTLSRMRSMYVLPLLAKFLSRLELLGEDLAKSPSAAARTKLQKQIELFRKKQAELLAYDERLRNYIDRRISIDLDDGVKANYAKFGELVAESKAITGGSNE